MMRQVIAASFLKSLGWTPLLLIFLVVACGGDSPAQVPEARTTKVTGAVPTPKGGTIPITTRRIEVDHTSTLKFEPASIRVRPGETVEILLTNSSGFFHTFTIASSRQKSEILVDEEVEGARSVTVVFPATPGEYYLFCRPHEFAGMVGTVTIE